jgi:threonine/homoserine/homoserine lactone efflux protein
MSFGTLIAFALVSLGMVCSPGPNMIYLISRSITQGRMAGVISLLGVMLGFLVYIIATMFGLTILFTAVPFVFETVKIAGGCHIIQLTTDKKREDALRFYERLGFKATHEGLKMKL